MMMGLNCTACHVGQVEYQGHAVRVDGGPSMALHQRVHRGHARRDAEDVDVPAAACTLLATRAGGARGPACARRRRRGRGRSARARRGVAWQIVNGALTHNRGLLTGRLPRCAAVPTLKAAAAVSTLDGYGRTDAFGVGRNELFGTTPERHALGRAGELPAHLGHGSAPAGCNGARTRTPSWSATSARRSASARCSIRRPAGARCSIENLQAWSSSPTSCMRRRGPLCSRPSIRRRPNADAPLRPVLRALPPDVAADGEMRIYKLFALNEVGTDPSAALNYEKPVKTADGAILPFPYAALELIKPSRPGPTRSAGLSPAADRGLGEPGRAQGPAWDPTSARRCSIREVGRHARDGRSIARRRSSGSGRRRRSSTTDRCPRSSICCIRRRSGRRPFRVGHHEYDPVKLGIETDPAGSHGRRTRCRTQLDTRLPGNWNTGHEWWFYPSARRRAAIRDYRVPEDLQRRSRARPARCRIGRGRRRRTRVTEDGSD